MPEGVKTPKRTPADLASTESEICKLSRPTYCKECVIFIKKSFKYKALTKSKAIQLRFIVLN